MFSLTYGNYLIERTHYHDHLNLMCKKPEVGDSNVALAGDT